MMRVDIPRNVDMFGHFRQMVEAGAPDEAVEVWHDGKHCLSIRSLYRAALRTVVEEPYLRLAVYTPHYMATVGPRIQALLDQRAAKQARQVSA